MVDRDHAVRLYERLTAEAVAFDVGVERQGHVAPADQIVADGVAPVNAVHACRLELVEHVVATVPLAEAVGVVHVVLGGREVVQGAVGSIAASRRLDSANLSTHSSFSRARSCSSRVDG